MRQWTRIAPAKGGCPACCSPRDPRAVAPSCCCYSPLRVVGDRTGSSALAGGGGLLAAAAMLASTSRYSSLRRERKAAMSIRQAPRTES